MGVTIAGGPFSHLLFHYWLAFSGWHYAKVIEGGESFTALTEGIRRQCGWWAAPPTPTAPTVFLPHDAIWRLAAGFARVLATNSCFCSE